MTDPGTPQANEKPHRGDGRVGPISTVVVILAMVAIAMISLYGLWAFWPSEAPGTKTLPASKNVHFFWLERKLSRESLFFVMIAFAGALGSVVHGLRSLVIYIGNRQLRWSWVPFYLVRPVVGSLLGTLLYVVLRAGLFSPSSSTQQTSPYGFAAVAALAGLFSDQAVEKLKKVAEELFVKVPTFRNAISVLPAAVTGAAESLGSTEARVRGTINPRGVDTTFKFEYGSSDQYGSETPAVSAGSGSVPRPVEASLTNLSPGTTYHYRLVGSSNAGTSEGDDQQFATPA